MEAYFDNSATTRVSDRVLDIVVKTMREDYGNPSAKHRMGVRAERYVKEAAAKIAKTLKVQEKEILFTSGGTESDNLALIGCALANERRGKHLITTSVEHPAVYQPLCFLESLGFEITILPVDGDGHISIEELKAAVRKDTTLVSVMYVNNEVGAVEPIAEIAAAIRCSMWTRSRATESSGSTRSGRASTFWRSAATSFTRRRAWASSTSTAG